MWRRRMRLIKFDSEDANFLTDNFLPNVLDLAVNSNGEQVGIPYSLSSPVLYINKDLLKEAGLSEDGPETWQEVQEFAEAVKEKTGKYGSICRNRQTSGRSRHWLRARERIC